MPKAISRRKLIDRLREFGFSGPLAGGRHLFMTKGTLVLHIPNPHREDISSDLLSKILKQADISTKEWRSKR